MIYFNPQPNYQVVSKYYKFPFSPEEMEIRYADGFDIHINHIYTDEAVAAIENGFKHIMQKYSLVSHYDNLLLLTLGKVQETEAILDELYFQYNQRKRTKELANFILTFIESKRGGNSLSLKTIWQTAKITDDALVSWVLKIIEEAVQSGNMPAGEFQYDIREILFDRTEEGLKFNVAKLKVEVDRTVVSPNKQVRKQHALLCFYLNAYIIGETNLKPNPDTLFSDQQLNLYFDILCLFGYINADNVDSENKDYMSSLLRNQLTKNQGNKTS
jgi:hypothetical protein